MKISKLNKKIVVAVLCSCISLAALPTYSMADSTEDNKVKVEKTAETDHVDIRANNEEIKTVKFNKSKEMRVNVISEKRGKGYLKIDISSNMLIGDEKDKKPLEIIVNDGGNDTIIYARTEDGVYDVNYSATKNMKRFVVPCSDIGNATFKLVDPNSEAEFKEEFLISVQATNFENEIVPAESYSEENLKKNHIEATSQYEDEKIYEGFVFGKIGNVERDTFYFRPEANSSEITLHIGAMSKNGFNYYNYGKNNKFTVEYFDTEETFKKIQKDPVLKDREGNDKYLESQYKKVEVSVDNNSTIDLPWYPEKGIIKIKLEKPNVFLFRMSVSRNIDRISNVNIPSTGNTYSGNNEENNSNDKVDSKAYRYSGSNRYKTAIELSKKAFNSSKVAVIASGENFADALSGGPLAYVNDAPLLLVGGESEASEVNDELNRLGVEKVYILGGRKSISAKVENKLHKRNREIVRLEGKNRYATSLEIYKEFTKFSGASDDTILVNGNIFADALSAGPYAAHTNRAIVLTNGHDVPKEAMRNPKRNTVIGGYSSMDKNIEGNRISGANRYETSVNIAKTFNDHKNVMLASGEKYPDGLASISLYKKYEGPLLLTPAKVLPKETKKYIKDNKIEDVYIIGGTNSVSSKIENMFK